MHSASDPDKFWNWLCNGVKRQLSSFSDLTNDEAARAIAALKNGGKK
jgi:hypothetical protein